VVFDNYQKPRIKAHTWKVIVHVMRSSRLSPHFCTDCDKKQHAWGGAWEQV